MNEEAGNKVGERHADKDCPHECKICYRNSLQMKWVVAGAILALGVVLTNKNDIGNLKTDLTEAKVIYTYQIQAINDIKRAMGLEVRLPPKLAEMKEYVE